MQAKPKLKRRARSKSRSRQSTIISSSLDAQSAGGGRLSEERIVVLFRIQDKEGRGPFRPGLSTQWADATGGKMLPPIYKELGIEPTKLRDIVPKGLHCGCACKTPTQLQDWFTRTERRRLLALGFGIVRFEPDVIIAETPNQVLFGCTEPLSTLPRISA